MFFLQTILTFFLSHKSYDELFRILNQELELVSDWFKANKLSLNLTKTNYIVFCSHRKSIPPQKGNVQIDNIDIPQVKSVKFLGVYVDQHITWNDHIEQITLKIAKNVGILKRISYLLPTKIRLTLYYSMIYPYISYCNMIWASNYNSRLLRIQVLQKKIIRIIAGSPYNSHTAQLFAKFGVLKLVLIKQLQINEFMHRYTYNTLPDSLANFYSLTSDIHSYNTRSITLYRIEFARTNSRRFSIRCTGPEEWNKLPLYLRSISNLKSFKHHLKAWIIDNI